MHYVYPHATQLFDGHSAQPKHGALDADSLCGNLVVRRPLNADRFQPFGMRGTKLLSDLLTDRHYSRIDKLHALVVTDDEASYGW